MSENNQVPWQQPQGQPWNGAQPGGPNTPPAGFPPAGAPAPGGSYQNPQYSGSAFGQTQPTNPFGQNHPTNPFGGPAGPGGPGQYGGPQKKSSPIGWILMIVAGLAAIIVGVLFATGVLGGSDAEEKKPQAQAEVTATPTPTSEPTSADPTPEETATSEKPKPPVADLPDGMYQYGDWGIAVIEYNNDATAEVTALPTYADGSITPLEADQKFVGIKVRLKNLSSDTLNTNWDSPPGLVLYTSENTFDYSFEEFLFGDEPGTVPAIGDLAPGAEGEGWYYVIVPADFTGGKLSFWEYDTFSEADEGLSVPLQ